MAVVVVLFVVFGFLNAFGFYLIGEVCSRTGSRTYQEAWRKTLGPDFAWLPSVASIIICLTSTVAGAWFVGNTTVDLAARAVATAGLPFAGPGFEAALCGISAFLLYPLCLLPSLAPLAFASLLGLVGVCLFAVMMVTRCLDGSYLPGGALHEATFWVPEPFDGLGKAATAPGGGQASGLIGLLEHGFVFLALISNAYSAHYNAPAILAELRAPEGEEGAKLASFRGVTGWAFGFTGVLFLAITLAGLQTFGAAVQPSVLSNYASADTLALAARVGLGFCVLFEYPLLERCFRATTVELLGLPPSVARHPAVAAASVALVTALASAPGLGVDKVNAFGGALGASFLIYVAPALMALGLGEAEAPPRPGAAPMPALAPALAEAPGARGPLEAWALRGLAFFGTALGSLGVATAAGLGAA